MRIGMMADMYKPHVSGITNYISLNKIFLEELGHQVFVFTFGDESYIEEEERVVRSPGLALLDTGVYISLRYTRHARKLLNSMDVVHVHHPFLSGSLALRYCRPRAIPGRRARNSRRPSCAATSRGRAARWTGCGDRRRRARWPKSRR